MTIKGYLQDAFKNEAPFSTVYESDIKGAILKNNVTTANENGYFVINVSSNNFLTIKSTGLLTATIPINLLYSTKDNLIQLKADPRTQLEEVIITPKKKNYTLILLIALLIAYNLKKK
jgi:hypothetical protein